MTSEEKENPDSKPKTDSVTDKFPVFKRSLSLNAPSLSLDSSKPDSPLRETTASFLAKIIVWTFTGSIAFSFIILAGQLCYFLLFTHNLQHEEIITLHGEIFEQTFELFKTVSAVVSGPIGFVLGFYFRESLSKEKESLSKEKESLSKEKESLSKEET